MVPDPKEVKSKRSTTDLISPWQKVIHHSIESSKMSEVKKKDRYLKDTERSTWWMADSEKNARMRRWLSNLEFKEEMKKQS